MMYKIFALKEKWNSENNNPWNFSGFVFIDDISPQYFLTKRFERSTSFHAATFHGNVNFRSAQFIDDVDFSSAVFKANANFSSAKFNKHANFFISKFYGDAVFSLAEFGGFAEFQATCFCENTFFISAKFFKDANFYLSQFDKDASLDGAEIYSKVGFDSVVFLERGFLSCKNVRIQEVGLLAIIDCNLSRISFGMTNLKQIQFSGHFFERRGGRIICGEEMRMRWERKHWGPQPDARWDITKQAYEKYLTYFEQQSDLQRIYELSSSIFEMNRLAPPLETSLGRILWGAKSQADYSMYNDIWYSPLWRVPLRLMLHVFKRYFSLTAFYRTISNYSGSILLPIFWLIVIILGFGTFYQSAIYRTDLMVFNEDGLTIALNVLGLNPRIIGEALKNAPAWIIYTSSDRMIITLMATIQLALSAVVVTLLVFAVRRRFRH